MTVDSTSELRGAAKADVKGRSEESRRIFPRLNPPPLAVHRSRELDYQGSGETRVHAMGWLAGRSFCFSHSPDPPLFLPFFPREAHRSIDAFPMWFPENRTCYVVVLPNVA